MFDFKFSLLIDFYILYIISSPSLSSNKDIKVIEHLYLRNAIIHLGKCFYIVNSS